MLTRIQLGTVQLTGVSVGGVYTSLALPELDFMFDVGIAPRSFVGVSNLALSHGHADHSGALVTLLGIRGLSKVPPPRIFLPAEIAEDVRQGVSHFNLAQSRGLPLELMPMVPGQEFAIAPDLRLIAFRTLHTVPSLGYRLVRVVRKLKAEWLHLSGPEIKQRRELGEDLFEEVLRPEVAYATDTLIDVLDKEPELYRSKILILECTFLDERKGRKECRDKCHIHLDEILERADRFENEHLVLMHFSQLYRPSEVFEILERRVPPHLAARLRIFAPRKGDFPG